MLSKKNFSQNYHLSSQTYKKNFIKTKRVFENFKIDFDVKIPLLQSYEKNYKMNFSSKFNELIDHSMMVLFLISTSGFGFSKPASTSLRPFPAMGIIILIQITFHKFN